MYSCTAVVFEYILVYVLVRRGEQPTFSCHYSTIGFQYVGVHSRGQIICLHAPRPQNHIVIARGNRVSLAELRAWVAIQLGWQG